MSATDETIAARLGYRFHDGDTLAVALTHRSVGGERPNNETLEFLGDAVLALAIAELLMERHPGAREGELSKLRAGLVNAPTLAVKARHLGLSDVLQLGRGEERSGGRAKESILAAAYEAVLGAVFVDGGYAAARQVIREQFAGDGTEAGAAGQSDFKTRLQEMTQRRFRSSPVYHLVEESGPDHAKQFTVELSVEGCIRGRGTGPSKKAAEQEAAMRALDALSEEDA